MLTVPRICALKTTCWLETLPAHSSMSAWMALPATPFKSTAFLPTEQAISCNKMAISLTMLTLCNVTKMKTDDRNYYVNLIQLKLCKCLYTATPNLHDIKILHAKTLSHAKQNCCIFCINEERSLCLWSVVLYND